MKRLVIFCGGYTVIETALYLITQNLRDRPITVVIVSTHPDLFKFFQIINEKVFDNKVEIIHFRGYQPKRAGANKIKKLLYLLPDIIKEKRHLKKLFTQNFADMEETEVYFSGKGFGTYAFYLLKKLSKTNRLVYVYSPDEVLPIEEFIPTNLTDLADLMINKLIYGFGITMGRLSYTHFPCLPDKFLKREVAETIDHAARKRMLRNFDMSRFKEIFDVGNYSVIYYHQDLVKVGFVSNSNTFKKELTEIFNLLSKYFPENEVGLKYHPRSPGDKTVLKFGKIIEDFIPGEFLYNDNVKVYLSPFSFALANVENGLAVSVADLITLRDDETRNHLKEMLIQMSHSKILFPKSLDEFEKIVVKLCSRVSKRK
ncbi:hypothetical protein ACFLXJ_04930 [Chloroflexota bacterium]